MVDYPVDVGILVSYFVLIGGLLWRIRSPLQQCIQSKQFGATVFFVGALGSFLCTWFYMISYFVHSYKEHDTSNTPVSLNTISHWLHNVSLFDDAWRTVSLGNLQWLWSHQLCLFTVGVWTPFLAVEGARRKIPYLWAYMLLGQVVAISTASALFFAVVLAYPRTDLAGPSRCLNTTLLICIFSGMVTVVLSPFVAASEWFLPNLLVMHVLLVFPLLPSKPAIYSYTEQTVYVAAVYMLSAGASLSIYVHQWITCLVESGSLYETLISMVDVFFAHPAQSSISSDVVWVQFLCVAWMLVDRLMKTGTVSLSVWTLIALTPIFSVSVTMPMYLAFSELMAASSKHRIN
ncbi:hypothetical protein BDB00DRAFT_756736 [Zychaea mexicana]|uniref:uncharacterized protein n=1 Tax=Zychaea mexicana TaxID=64656 RepID=UPI0022FEBF4E|nr:uncharacterized protein BDB00DRAFT_756736 [Zychaea mexicana]KAI9497366.1 hypothetical protein BDB00DRAFT_756736 [Zychaea mexicana]